MDGGTTLNPALPVVTAAAPAAGQVIQVQCPPGAGPGSTIQVQHGGATLSVPVPAGIQPGMAFPVQTPAAVVQPVVVVPPSEVQVVRVAGQPVGGGAAAPAAPVRVDTSALTGLRGLAALHVALGHYGAFSEIGVDLMGGAAMPFFYLLSGFVMTLGYGRDDKVHSRKFYQVDPSPALSFGCR